MTVCEGCGRETWCSTYEGRNVCGSAHCLQIAAAGSLDASTRAPSPRRHTADRARSQPRFVT